MCIEDDQLPLTRQRVVARNRGLKATAKCALPLRGFAITPNQKVVVEYPAFSYRTATR